MAEILFVCSGNTCRSPLAEAILNGMAVRRGLAVRACSAGISALYGAPATDEALAVAAERGVSLARHLSRAVAEAMVREAKTICVMTPTHRAILSLTFGIPAERIRVLDLPDPYGLGISAYRELADRLELICAELLDDYA